MYLLQGFTSAGWRYTIVGALAVVAFYKYAPAAGEDNFVTRYIAHYYTPKEVWERINNKHLVMTAEMQENAQVIQGAKRPPIHRFRHPQCVYYRSYLS
ncbi:hypothetical protein BV25DRAFT_1821125 [Artomyces pyxidatus]|uniref:Uncharacterized protein n=1 Tax=Artomyces pyxidatus TaxID=48021 RepID=A0ACB8TD73_9AGAM|nr:hypothetical protein BV25DRAFT_1821125 [Artomyces pyxidatus]